MLRFRVEPPAEAVRIVNRYGQLTLRLKAESAGVPAGTKVETITLSPTIVFVVPTTLISPPVAPTIVAVAAHALTSLLNVTVHWPTAPAAAVTAPALLLELTTAHSELTTAQLF